MSHRATILAGYMREIREHIERAALAVAHGEAPSEVMRRLSCARKCADAAIAQDDAAAQVLGQLPRSLDDRMV